MQQFDDTLNTCITHVTNAIQPQLTENLEISSYLNYEEHKHEWTFKRNTY